MGRTKPERSPESVAKATKSMAKKLVCIFFFDVFFFEACSEAGHNCSLFNMGKTKPERSPESVAKATKSMAQKNSLYYFFLTCFFLKQILKLGATVHYSIWGRQNQKEAPKVLQKLLKAWQKN